MCFRAVMLREHDGTFVVYGDVGVVISERDMRLSVKLWEMGENVHITVFLLPGKYEKKKATNA